MLAFLIARFVHDRCRVTYFLFAIVPIFLLPSNPNIRYILLNDGGLSERLARCCFLKGLYLVCRLADFAVERNLLTARAPMLLYQGEKWTTKN